ncbi:DUF4332 domain-containing protein [Synechococcus sp. PCC 7336]|uniref:DUF4332 domain-containing protein n=1 Tax=Synechococcus sp. PCC 7336 TaxID=195250 RepID=UPI0003805AEE|nr:DUF4332 domain-containing protein [Synechococcus sp. PCC 7336]
MPDLSAQYWPIEQLPGLNASDRRKLKHFGLVTTADLLNVAQSGNCHKTTVAAQLQTKVERLNRWLAMADLARLPAVGCQYCGLLLHAGMLSVTDLSAASAPQLHRLIQRLHVSTLRSVRNCPSVAQVSQWIYQARHLG